MHNLFDRRNRVGTSSGRHTGHEAAINLTIYTPVAIMFLAMLLACAKSGKKQYTAAGCLTCGSGNEPEYGKQDGLPEGELSGHELQDMKRAANARV